MSATLIPYPGSKETPLLPPGLPDPEELRQQYWQRGEIQRQIEDILRNHRTRGILETVLSSLSDGARRESVQLPRHSCIITQQEFTELAAVAGFYSMEPLEGHKLRWYSAYLLPRVEAVHTVTKILRVYVLPDPQNHDHLALQFERSAVRNMRFLESGKIEEAFRTEALLEISEQLDFVDSIAKGRERAIFRKFRQWSKGGGA